MLHKDLRRDGFRPWLDEEDLLPGEEWDVSIRTAVRSSAAVVVCLSGSSITKEGYVQKEIRLALDVADEKREGTIFLIPLRLEDCDVPARLRRWQWVDLFQPGGYEKLLAALRSRISAVQDNTKARKPSRERSHRLNEEARERVQDWGKRMSAFGRWDWEPLFVATERYVAAILQDPTFQHPWTNLAYVFHLFGKKDAATTYLSRSRSIASDINDPGSNFRNVAQAIQRDAYLSGGSVRRPSLDSASRERLEKLLNAIDAVLAKRDN
jgi:hypothetical protein